MNKRSLASSLSLSLLLVSMSSVAATAQLGTSTGTSPMAPAPGALPGTLPGLGTGTTGGTNLNLPSGLNNAPSALPPVSPPAGGAVPFGTQSNTPGLTPLPGLAPSAGSGLGNTGVPTIPSAGAASGLPSAVTGSPAVPNGAMSPMTAGAPNTTDILDPNAQTPAPPLMGAITQEVAFTIDKQPVQRGPFTGMVVHLHNGTNSPLMFDGDRARIKVGDGYVTAISDLKLEEVTAPPPTAKHETKMFFANALTVGAYSASRDAKVEHGQILPRYGKDQMRREATLERFGTRIVWPGDDTQGIVFFNTDCDISKGNLELPVVTFPNMEVRGYLTGLR